MTILGALSELVDRRSLENPQVPISDAALAEWLNSGSGFKVDSGVTVTPTGSLAMSSVWRANNLISGVASSLPLKGYVRGADDTRSPAPSRVSAILREPHTEMTDVEFWRLTYAHRGLWGNFYGFKNRDGGGVVRSIDVLSPGQMQVGRYAWARGETNPSGKVFVYVGDDGVQHVWTPADVLHIPGFGYDGVCGVSPIRMARQAIGLALAAEKYGARLFGNGSLVSGVLQTEQRLDETQANLIKEQWKSRMAGIQNSHEVAVLDSGAKFQTLTMPNSDAQFLESRMFQIGEIERFYGIPPFLMFDTEKSTSWGTGLEQQATGWVQFDLGPQWLRPTEARVTRELVATSDRSAYAEYSVDGLLRGDSLSRGAFYRIMREVGAYSANDIRQLENRNPIEGGDVYLQPVNLAPLGYDPSQGATP